MLQASTRFEVGITSFISMFQYHNVPIGLADTLHSELQLYGIDVHIYYPNTIFSPGYEEECKTKPGISQEVEGTVEGYTPEQCAKILLKGKTHLVLCAYADGCPARTGVTKGHFDIVNDFFGNVFRSSCRRGTPRRSYFVEGFLDLFAFVSSQISSAACDFH